MAGATGTATIDFGAFPGAAETSVVVTGQASIGSGAQVEAYFMASDTTADHSADDHKYAAALMGLSCGDIVAGTGFTIHARALDAMQGTFTVHWVWTQ